MPLFEVVLGSFIIHIGMRGRRPRRRAEVIVVVLGNLILQIVVTRRRRRDSPRGALVVSHFATTVLCAYRFTASRSTRFGSAATGRRASASFVTSGRLA
jgi:hypothetical protein